MWFKLDDGFATHPKILKAGPLGLVIQIRALCYASQNKTDGFLPHESIPLFLNGLDIAFDWPAHMLSRGLWEPHEQGYQIHDWLSWNCSKQEYVKWKKKLSQGGKKGMQARWGKDKRTITTLIGEVITDPVTVSSTSTSTLNSLNSSESGPNPKSNGSAKLLKGKRPIAESDKPTEKHFDFGRALGIDVGPEWGKFKNYCLAHDKRYANFEAAFRNWLANVQHMKGGRA